MELDIDKITERKHRENKTLDKVKVSEDVLIKSMMYTNLVCKIFKGIDLEIWGYFLGSQEKFDGIVTNTVLKPYQVISSGRVIPLSENQSLDVLQAYMEQTNQKRIGTWHGHARMGPFHSTFDNDMLSCYGDKMKGQNIFQLGTKKYSLIGDVKRMNQDGEKGIVSLVSNEMIPREITGKLNGQTPEQVLELLKSIEIEQSYGPVFFYSVVFDSDSIGCVKDSGIDKARWLANYRSPQKRIYLARLLIQNFESDKQEFTGMNDDAVIEIVPQDNHLEIGIESLVEDMLKNVIYKGKFLSEHKDSIYKTLGLYKTTITGSEVRKSIREKAKEQITAFEHGAVTQEPPVIDRGKSESQAAVAKDTASGETARGTVSEKKGGDTSYIAVHGQILQELRDKSAAPPLPGLEGIVNREVIKEITNVPLARDEAKPTYSFSEVRSCMDSYNLIEANKQTKQTHSVFGNVFGEEHTNIDYKTAFSVRNVLDRYFDENQDAPSQDRELYKNFLDNLGKSVLAHVKSLQIYLEECKKSVHDIFYKDGKNDFIVESIKSIHKVTAEIKPFVNYIKEQKACLKENLTGEQYAAIEAPFFELYGALRANIPNQIGLLTNLSSSDKDLRKFKEILGEWKHEK